MISHKQPSKNIIFLEKVLATCENNIPIAMPIIEMSNNLEINAKYRLNQANNSKTRKLCSLVLAIKQN